MSIDQVREKSFFYLVFVICFCYIKKSLVTRKTSISRLPIQSQDNIKKKTSLTTMKRFQSQIAGSILLVNILLSTLVATTKIPFDSDVNSGGSISINSKDRLIDSINYKPYHSNHVTNSNDNNNDNSKAALGVLLRALIDESIDDRLSELTNDEDNEKNTIRRLIEAKFYVRFDSDYFVFGFYFRLFIDSIILIISL